MNDYQLLKLSQNQDCEAYSQGDIDQENCDNNSQDVNQNIIEKCQNNAKKTNNFAKKTNNFYKKNNKSVDDFRQFYQNFYNDVKQEKKYIKEDW